MAKAQLTREQKTRLVEQTIEQIDEQAALNAEREKVLKNQHGLELSPLTRLAAQVETLIHWTAPSEYARARFDLDVERTLEHAMSDEQVGIAADQRREIERAMEAAAAGRTESGLYVPEPVVTPALVVGSKPDLAVAPEPTQTQAIRPPSPK